MHFIDSNILTILPSDHAERAQRYSTRETMNSSSQAQGHVYVSPAEVAKHLRVDVATIRRMCDRKEIPGARKVGRQWRIPATFLTNPQAA